MSKKSKNTKGKIVMAAWELFYRQGYDATTIDEIIEASQTSKGSFYHYFEGKEALLGSLAYLFDEKYAELESLIDPNAHCLDVLLWLNSELFGMIENKIDLSLLTKLYSAQLNAKGAKELLDHSRLYYRLLRRIISAGQENGQITDKITVSEATRLYALCERALLYDWCLCDGAYSLKDYAATSMKLLLSGLKNE